MMSKLILGGDKESRRIAAEKLVGQYVHDRRDRYTITDQPISITHVRELITWLRLKPWVGPYKAAILFEAQSMKTYAQNALLKTLEEPQDHTLILLTVPSEDSLLPTVVSRCSSTRLTQITSVSTTEKDSLCELFSSEGDISQSFHLAEIYGSDKEHAQEWYRKLLEVGHTIIIKELTRGNIPDESKTRRLLRRLHALLEFGKTLETNVSPRFAVENLLLSW